MARTARKIAASHLFWVAKLHMRQAGEWVRWFVRNCKRIQVWEWRSSTLNVLLPKYAQLAEWKPWHWLCKDKCRLMQTSKTCPGQQRQSLLSRRAWFDTCRHPAHSWFSFRASRILSLQLHRREGLLSMGRTQTCLHVCTSKSGMLCCRTLQLHIPLRSMGLNSLALCKKHIVQMKMPSTQPRLHSISQLTELHPCNLSSKLL